MEEKFVKEGKRLLSKTEEQMDVELIINILKAKKELDVANSNFEFADNEMVDYYSYQIKASKSKLDYLMKQAKKQGIVLDMINEIYLRRNNVG